MRSTPSLEHNAVVCQVDGDALSQNRREICQLTNQNQLISSPTIIVSRLLELYLQLQTLKSTFWDFHSA